MISKAESLCLYSTLTTFFTFDIFKSLFAERINGEDGEISYIRSGDGEDEVLITRNGEDEERGMGNGVLEAGDGKYK